MSDALNRQSAAAHPRPNAGKDRPGRRRWRGQRPGRRIPAGGGLRPGSSGRSLRTETQCSRSLPCRPPAPPSRAARRRRAEWEQPLEVDRLLDGDLRRELDSRPVIVIGDTPWTYACSDPDRARRGEQRRHAADAGIRQIGADDTRCAFVARRRRSWIDPPTRIACSPAARACSPGTLHEGAHQHAHLLLGVAVHRDHCAATPPRAAARRSW
jgi:hypothetical protein